MKRLIACLLLIPALALAQVTTNPAVTGVPAPQSAVAITGGTINGTPIGGTTPAAGAFTTLTTSSTFNPTTQLGGGGAILYSSTAPTIASGFGTNPSIVASNGTAAFKINVGTGGTASTGTITLPASGSGWVCFAAPNGAPQAAAVTYSSPASSSSMIITNYTLTTGVALAWTSGTVLQMSCFGY